MLCFEQSCAMYYQSVQAAQHKEKTMENCDIIKSVWPEWEIQKQLGRGSYGIVYQAVRRDYKVESHAAIKVISVPTDPAELDTLLSDGYDQNGTYTYFQEIKDGFVQEIQLMQSLKGLQNIVSIEDYKVIEKKNEIGWYVIIRMELLTPLTSCFSDHSPTEEDVIRLGLDLCNALEICKEENIIHRDIKPQNILVNNRGDYKLGDFGVAKQLSNITGTLSAKGAYNYMAPEVVNGTGYDEKVDIYSLGLVLYRLMNRNTLPFLDPGKQMYSSSERVEALDKRLSGKKLPPPEDASPALADIILKACAHDPEERYKSASEMKEALLSIEKSASYAAKKNKNILLTAVVFTAVAILIIFFRSSKNWPGSPGADTTNLPQQKEIFRTGDAAALVLEPFFGDISNYELLPFISAAASSALQTDGLVFPAENVTDGLLDTSWQESADGNGIGEWICVVFPCEEQVDLLSLRLGSACFYAENNRPKTLEFEFSNGKKAVYTFSDDNRNHLLRLSESVQTTWMKVTIQDVYRGEIAEINDTCITEIEAYSREEKL